jgi:group I intron endonuclease
MNLLAQQLPINVQKQNLTNMIIYKHTCVTSGKSYIGKTVKTMMERWWEHCSDAKYHPKRKFFAALNKYGKDNWEHEILFECDDPKILADKEIEYIKEYDSVKNGYNTMSDKSRINTKHNPESIERMRVSQKAAHARRREFNGGIETTEKHKKHKPHTSGWAHPSKGKSNPNCGPETGRMGWKKINGVRTWFLKQEATV